MEPEFKAILPLDSASTVGSPTDFTFKFWFKAQDLQPNEALQFLSFEQSVTCYITSALSIMCDTPERQRLVVDVNNYTSGKWYYFALTVTKRGNANLSIYDKYGIVASDETTDFYLVQVPSRDWGVCFGVCDSDSNGMELGFRGGIREVVVCDEIESELDSNKIRSFRYAIKGYYRFAYQDVSRFASEQFREEKITANFEISDAFGRDMIPSDMCPRSFNTNGFVNFSGDQMVRPQRFEKRLPQNRYAYTMSLTVNLDSNTCRTASFLTAQKQNCNIVLVEDVFMLFLSDSNAARFHFFAEKNYFESQSSAFFVPYNEWITIQMHMTQIDGYQIVVLDQDGTILLNFARSTSMYSQMPKNEFSLFSGLAGYVDRFIFTDKAYYLPQTLSRRLDDSPIIDVSFSNLNSTIVPNVGRSSDLRLTRAPLTQIIPYYTSEYGATPAPRPQFDGVACDDGHMTMLLTSETSYFSFETPPMSDWMSETSINFWFKVTDWQSLRSKSAQTSSIFTMQTGNGFQQFWFVFVRGGELVIAPFGLQKLSEPVVIFPEFNSTNSDDLGWWHLSCYYQFYAKVECTLHNKNLELTRVKSLMGNSDYFFPQFGLTATFGKTDSQTFPAVESLMIKEISYWSRKVMLPEAQVMRYHQIDPVQTSGLLSYFRLAQGKPTLSNFAEFNPDYTFKAANPRYSQAVWKSDFITTSKLAYDEPTASLVLIDQLHYHNVCPLYTYIKNGICYSEPVNEARVMFFPQWNVTSEALDWLFTLEQSSFIESQISKQLSVEWSSDDTDLKSLLRNDVLNQVISSEDLRNENDYHIKGSLTNTQQIFKTSAHADFIPNKCQWFEVGTDDAYSGSRQINLMPGAEDFEFYLSLQTNPRVDCSDFDFFDEFKSVQFKFVAQTNDESYMIEQPKVNYKLVSPSALIQRTQLNQATEGPEVQNEARSASDLVVYVTIPQEEQYKIPVWTNIKIIMTIDWMSSKFTASNHHSYVFQNAMYTIQFNPLDNYLIPKVNQNYKFVQKTQTLILSANETTVSNLYPSQLQHMLSYRWICPEGLELLCKGQESDTLYIPWNRIGSVPLKFSTLYTFAGEITWTKPDGTNETRKDSLQVQWYNLQKPIFEIATIPATVLVTSTRQTEFEIVGTNFDATLDMSIYQIDWLITPPLESLDAKNIYNYGQRMTIEAGSWTENTNYTVTCKLYFQEEPTINGSSFTTFSTFAPPENGTVIIWPDYGYIGDTFLIMVDGFVDPTSAVVYNVFNSFDETGTLKGAQLNNKTIPQQIDYRYKAQTANPIIVEVQNLIGEKVTTVLYPWLVPKPEPICETKQICPEPEPEVPEVPSNSTNSTETTPDEPSADQPPSTEEPTPNVQPNNATQGGRRLRNKAVRQSQPRPPGTSPNATANSTDPEDPCEYITTCIQPEFDFTQERPPFGQYKEPVNNSTPNDTIPVDENADSFDGGRRLAQEDVCQQYDQSSHVEDAFAAYDLTGEICILEAVLSENTQQQVLGKLQQSAGYQTSYKSEKIEVASVKFNLAKAAQNENESLFALDVEYYFSSEALKWQFPNQPSQDFYMQAIAVKDDTTQVVLRVIDSVTGGNFALKDLDGQASLRFRIDPDTYLPGQTVCQGLLQGEWVSNVCLTEIDVQNELASCLCGLTQGVTNLAFRNDMSLAQGESVDFPEPEVLMTPELEGTSYFFMGVVICVSLAGILGSLISWKLDRRDQAQISELTGWKLNLVMAVASKLNQPVELVKLRQFDLSANSSQLSIIGKVHPLFAPFLAVIAGQSRLLRFTAYHLQVNMFLLACMVYYGPTYRANDSMRQEIFLDSTDVSAITFTTLVGSIMLLPIISEPVCWLLSNKVQVSNSAVEVKKQCAVMKALFIFGCLIVNLSSVIAAVQICKNAPTANQYVLAASGFSGLFMATVGTNLLRSGLQALAPVSCLTTTHAKQLIGDLKAVADIDLTKFKMVDAAEASTSREEQPFKCAQMDESEKYALKAVMSDRTDDLHSMPQQKKRGRSVL